MEKGYLLRFGILVFFGGRVTGQISRWKSGHFTTDGVTSSSAKSAHHVLNFHKSLCLWWDSRYMVQCSTKGDRKFIIFLPGRLPYLSLTFGWRSWNFTATLWCRCLSLCNSLSKTATLSCNLLSSPLAARSAGFEDESTMSSSSINSSSFLPLRESGESPPCWKLHKRTIISHALSRFWRVLILLMLCISSYSYLVSLPFQNLFHSLQGIWTTDSDYTNPTIRN